jgi:mRNA interferase RelE/StbE
MTYQVFLLKKTAEKLDTIPHPQRIRDALSQLSDFPHIKHMLQIENGIYRLRIGEYRALFKVYEDEKMIVVVNVDVRGRIYKGL